MAWLEEVGNLWTEASVLSLDKSIQAKNAAAYLASERAVWQLAGADMGALVGALDIHSLAAKKARKSSDIVLVSALLALRLHLDSAARTETGMEASDFKFLANNLLPCLGEAAEHASLHHLASDELRAIKAEAHAFAISVGPRSSR